MAQHDGIVCDGASPGLERNWKVRTIIAFLECSLLLNIEDLEHLRYKYFGNFKKYICMFELSVYQYMSIQTMMLIGFSIAGHQIY